MRALAIAALIVLAAAAGAARGDAGEDGFHAAEAKLSRGDVAGAVDAFVAVADGAPQSTWADDALAEAARGAEQLGQLGRAAVLWRRIVEQYPSSRQARRAEMRLGDLLDQIGPHGEWADVAAEHDRLLQGASGKAAPFREIAGLIALLRMHPDYPRATAARIWIGDTAWRFGDLDAAETWYAEAALHAPKPIDRWRAAKALADVEVARGDYDGAAQAYAALRGGAGRLEEAALDEADAALATARARHRRAGAAWIFLALAALAALLAARHDAGSWRVALRTIARPPLEVFYAAPVAALLGLLAWQNDAQIGAAIAWIAGGGLGVAWLSGAVLVGARTRGRIALPRASLHAAVALCAALAIAYLAILHGNLIDMLLETWRHGHDR